MNTTLKSIISKEKKYWLAAFLLPVVVMVISLLTVGVYPGSDISIMASDSFSQFSNFHASFHNVLTGKQSIFYTWNASLGLNYLALISYYLGGVFTPLVALVPNQFMPDTLYFLTLLKFGFSGLSFWIFSRNTYKVAPIFHVGMSTIYALMAFSVVHSELVMWQDTFVWLPLILLGIHRLMDSRNPRLLFISYFILFVSNFYFGFMVGVFSLLYYFARLLTDWKKYKNSLPHYFLTSFLAGFASMIIILPTLLDLRANGETLTEITKWKTPDSSWFDLIVKNMVGVYDTTKYGSIPFIYIGLLPLIFCTFYFISRKIPGKNKLLFGGILALLIASFYLEPLNLFWHGFHAPNMFLFRYSFLLSVLVIVLAGYALEVFRREDFLLLASIIIGWSLLFIAAFSFKAPADYSYVTVSHLAITVGLLMGYLILSVLYDYMTGKHRFSKNSKRFFTLIVSAFVFAEVTINSIQLVQGILDDWNYPSRSLYTEPYKDYKNAVDTVKNKDDDEFYRMENLTPVSSNDAFNYGFSGVSMFSSIRNRNTSNFLNTLGFRSRGTNLNIRYSNNTLIMDSLLGIRYNQTKNNLFKYGFGIDYHNETYTMYRNQFAASLGILTDNSIYSVSFPENDNLSSQESLLNQLAGTNASYFSHISPEVIGTDNTQLTMTDNTLNIREKEKDQGQSITWTVNMPAQKQAYLSLFPKNFSELDGAHAELTVNGINQTSQINISGQYYDLGYFPNDSTVEFTVTFTGSKSLSFIKPPIILLDIPAYEEAMTGIQKNNVPFQVTGRKANAAVSVEENSVLFTTIPYDKGWSAKVNGKKVEIKEFKNAFITLPLEKGVNTIELTFLPQGFLIGLLLCIGSILIFIIYERKLKNREKT
ncbi:YfhO family protein [Vagococcus elongatus]|uniref:Copper ABC transporter permease n=1 Tax=Vagococcus elongatus TaxID=180344 RepID=A0A430AZR4_9ENTE|nr:YfhO family protein [Vagococcus elongatus]RSU13549.1 copper ABC transporter permease [Vagococcus elongatus]